MIVRKFNKKLPNYQEITEVYKKSFPTKQRLPHWALAALARREDAEFLVFYDEALFCGLAFFAIYQKTIYIGYLAVNDAIRSKGYGSKILKYLQKKYQGYTIILHMEEVDEQADNYEQRVSRKAFYLKNGYKETDYIITAEGQVFDTLYLGDNFEPELFDRLVSRMTLGLPLFRLKKKVV